MMKRLWDFNLISMLDIQIHWRYGCEKCLPLCRGAQTLSFCLSHVGWVNISERYRIHDFSSAKIKETFCRLALQFCVKPLSKCYFCHHVIFVTVLFLSPFYLYHSVIYVTMQSFSQCYLCHNVFFVTVLFLSPCYLCYNVTSLLSCQCYHCNNVICCNRVIFVTV